MARVSFVCSVVGLGLLAAACARDPVEVSEADIARIAPTLGQQTARCPTVALRPGTQAHRTYLSGRDLDPQAVRYQGTIREGVRECQIGPDSMSLNVGVSGRILFGPAGEPGTTVVLPLRIVVVRSNTPVYSELHRVSVVTNPGETSRSWNHVQRDVIVTREPGDSIGDYEIIVGFDG